jgi:hypothetical protein
VIALASYGVILLHVVGALLLLYSRTRLPLFVAYVLFSLANHLFFNIGTFPWLTLAGTTFFFDPGWPRRFVPQLRRLLVRLISPQFTVS